MPSSGNIGALIQARWSVETKSCGAMRAAEAQRSICANDSGPKTLPSWYLRKNQLWLDGSSIAHSPEEDPEGAGVGEAGIRIVWPACNFNGLSMWLYFCKSLTVTPCILAMEVSVSPRATTCALPLAGLVADSAGAGVP